MRTKKVVLPLPRRPVLTFLNIDAREFWPWRLIPRGTLRAVAEDVLRPLGACGLCGQGPIYRVSIWPVDRGVAIATGFCAKCYHEAHNVRGSVAQRTLRKLTDAHTPWAAEEDALNRHHRLLAKQKGTPRVENAVDEMRKPAPPGEVSTGFASET